MVNNVSDYNEFGPFPVQLPALLSIFKFAWSRIFKISSFITLSFEISFTSGTRITSLVKVVSDNILKSHILSKLLLVTLCRRAPVCGRQQHLIQIFLSY